MLMWYVLICSFSQLLACSDIVCEICTTCITSASVALNVLDFPVVFLDEASMSTEPASLIPLMKGVRVSPWISLPISDV